MEGVCWRVFVRGCVMRGRVVKVCGRGAKEENRPAKQYSDPPATAPAPAPAPAVTYLAAAGSCLQLGHSHFLCDNKGMTMFV